MNKTRTLGSLQSLRSVALVVAAVFATIVPFRGLLSGRYIGDSFDARWTTTLYEHWYLVLTGAHSVRQTGIYFPYPNTLGFSDAFLLPGLLHSILRVSGANMVSAWAITNLLLQIIFVSGLFVLSGQIFRRTLIRVVFIAVAGSGYTWVAQLEHPQTLMYGLIVWIIVAFIAGVRSPAGAKNLAWPYIPVLTAVLALSAWYPFFFLVLLVPIAVAGAIIFVPWHTLWGGMRRALTRVPAALGFVSLGIFAGGMALWAWIYLPVADEVDRSWDDYLTHAPTFIDFLGSNHLGGGVWGPVFDRLEWLYRSPPANLEARVGFTPLLLIAFAVTMVTALAILSRRSSSLARIELTLGWTVILTWVVIAVDARGTSPFLLAWLVPGGDAVRAPMRVNIILSIVALAAVLLALEHWLSRRLGASGRAPLIAYVAVGIFGLILVAEQIRDDTARWTFSAQDASLLSQAQRALTSEQCAVFRITQSNAPSPDDTPVLESLVAVASRIPTTGGYSGGAPRTISPPESAVCVLSWPSMDVVRI